MKDKVIVITGAGGVICSELAKFLASKGSKIALLDINYEKLKEVEKNLLKNGYIVKAYKTDVLSKDSLLKAKEEINKDFGNVDILINGAGGNNPKATTEFEYYNINDEIKTKKNFLDLDLDAIRFVFDLNILGTILPTQVFLKDMIGKDNCSILNISSMNAYTPLTKILAYSSAKAAVSNFTKWLAIHLSKGNIRVNAIAPGFLKTYQNEKLLFNEDGTPTIRANKILKNTPMNRFVNPNELNYSVEFLINSKKSSAITGIILPVDCGFSAYSGV